MATDNKTPPNSIRSSSVLDRTLDSSPAVGKSAPNYLQATIDSSSAGDRRNDGRKQDESSLHPVSTKQVRFITGSDPGLSTETRNLLKQRLRAAAIMLAIGFSVFFIRSYFILQLDLPGETFAWLSLGAVAAIESAIFFVLYNYCPECSIRLRTFELVIFGLPILEFVMHSSLIAYQFVSVNAPPPQGYTPVVPWVMVIFSYSIFIPNGWKRAAVVLGGIGAIAAATFFTLAIYTGHNHPIFTLNNALTQSLMLLIAIMTGIWGVFNMTRLRAEAYEAKQMGNYKLLRKIGAGGMGEVYLAEHQLMKRPVAIKLIHPNQSHDPHALARFEREVRATAKLSHWNSIEIYDYGRTPDGTFYYVMEFLPGLSVGDLVERNGPMPGERVVYLLQQVCAGLQEAHSLGLIHRDLKPGNIFSAYRGGYYDVAKLLDFGLAKPVMSNAAMDLTVAGAITGSPLYMSPEQAIGEREPDARSDIYSLGGVAYFMLTGHSPFEGTNPIRVMWAHAEQTPVAPSQHNPSISPDLEAIVMKCLAKSPDDRFASTVELSNAMANCSFENQWTTARAEEWWETYCGDNFEGTACAQAEAIMSAEI